LNFGLVALLVYLIEEFFYFIHLESAFLLYLGKKLLLCRFLLLTAEWKLHLVATFQFVDKLGACILDPDYFMTLVLPNHTVNACKLLLYHAEGLVRFLVSNAEVFIHKKSHSRKEVSGLRVICQHNQRLVDETLLKFEFS